MIDTGINQGPERAYLIAVDASERDDIWSVDDSLAELAALARTAGAEVVGMMQQHLSHPDPVTYLGKGKLQELADVERTLEFDLVIVDDELAPVQQQHLEKVLRARVVDRTALILDIFALHARTREGRLQVELAQLEYRLPRLSSQDIDFSRQAGGTHGAGAGGAIGVRGPGETRLEIDRRRIRSRIAELNDAIEDVRRQRTIYRRQRAEHSIPVVAVVGYTNAGKSTVFNALTTASVLAEDKLFATLDPITRHMQLPGNQEVLLTDTVGFMQKLPTRLIAAFRATLEEVIEADLLLEVVDISHVNAIEQSETVNDILGELHVQEKPRVTALNKMDLLEQPDEIDLSLYPNAVAISAHNHTGLDALLEKVALVLSQSMENVRVMIPYTRTDLVELFHRRGHVERETHQEQGTLMKGQIPRTLRGYYRDYLVTSKEM